MDSTTLEALEYPQVLSELSSYCSTFVGRQFALNLRPFQDILAIRESYREYMEAASILKEGERLPLWGSTDVRPILTRTLPEGAYYLPEEFVLIREFVSVVIHLKSLLTPDFEKRRPRITLRIGGLSDLRPLLKEIDRVFDDKGEIKDNASGTLFNIRRDIRQIKERTRTLLDGMLKDKKTREMLQEELVTIRDDRYVLLIKEGKHTEFKGIVHGRSASGATYFIEPFELVEVNNRLNILKKEEASEEIEILKALTRETVSRRSDILNDVEVVSALDVLQAKALFGAEIAGVVPDIHEGVRVSLKGARHPLLMLNEIRGAGKVVPVDIEIGEGVRVLVVSGANTGGKTVALKTLGLLTLMASTGIPVPALAGSVLSFFKSVYADIGDKQDIMASLSTFSAHIKRLNVILPAAGPSTLLLLDEIGAGTDPVEGGALALSVLETLKERGALTVVTTHLNLLKAHAATAPAYLNASVEFDEGTLHPLYNLKYGIPGPSLGLKIAEGLGIPADIVERARTHVKDKDAAFVDSIRRLEEEREGVKRIKEGLAAVDLKRREAVERLKSERDAIITKVREKAEEEVRKARAEMRETIERLKEEAASARESSLEAARKASLKMEEIGGRVLARFKAPGALYVPREGDRVRITDSNTRGVVLSVDGAGKRAELQVGAMKVWADFSRLEKREGGRKGGEAGGARGVGGLKRAPHRADMEVSGSINIIGMRADEAEKILSKFLDDAHAAGLDSVEVIHGVGKGILAKMVADFLKASSYVKGFRHGDPLKGGGGVTIVEFK